MADDEATLEVVIASDTSGFANVIAAAQAADAAIARVGTSSGSRGDLFADVRKGLDTVNREAEALRKKLAEAVNQAPRGTTRLASGTIPGLRGRKTVAEAESFIDSRQRVQTAEVLGASAARRGVDTSTKAYKEYALQVDKKLDSYLQDSSKARLEALQAAVKPRTVGAPARRELIGNTNSLGADAGRIGKIVANTVQNTAASVSAKEKTPPAAAAPEATVATKAATKAQTENTAALKANTEATKTETKSRKAETDKPLRIINDGGSGGSGNSRRFVLGGDDPDGPRSQGFRPTPLAPLSDKDLKRDLQARRAAADPNSFLDLKGGVVADLTGPIAKFFEKTTTGVRELSILEEKFFDSYVQLLGHDAVAQINALGKLEPIAKRRVNSSQNKRRSEEKEEQAANREKEQEDRDRIEAANEARLRLGAGSKRQFNGTVEEFGKNGAVAESLIPSFSPDFLIRTKAGFKEVERDSDEYLRLEREFQEKQAKALDKAIRRDNSTNSIRPNELAERADRNRSKTAQDRAIAEDKKRTQEIDRAVNLARVQQGARSGQTFNDTVQQIGKKTLAEGVNGPRGFNPDFLTRAGEGYDRVVKGTQEYDDLLLRFQKKIGAELAKAAELAGDTSGIRPGELADRARVNREAKAQRDAQKEQDDRTLAATREANLARLQSNVRPGRVFNDNVRSVGRNTLAQITPGREFNPEFLDKAGNGYDQILTNTQRFADETRRFQQKEGQIIADAIEASSTGQIRPGELAERRARNLPLRDQQAAILEEKRRVLEQTRRDNLASLQANARPGQTFNDDVRSVGKKTLAQGVGGPTGFNPDFLRQAGEGYDRVLKGTQEYDDLLLDFQRKEGAELAKLIKRAGDTSGIRPGELAERARVNQRVKAEAAARKAQEDIDQFDARAENLRRIRSNPRTGRTFNDNVKSAGSNILSETTAGREFNPDFLRLAGNGYDTILRNTQKFKELTRAFQEREGRALAETIEASAVGTIRPGELQQRRAFNQARLLQEQGRAAAEAQLQTQQERRQKTDLLARRAANPEGFVRVNKDVTADLTGPVAVFFKRTKDGVEKITHYAEDFELYVEQLARKGVARQGGFDPVVRATRRTQSSVAQQRANALDLRDGAHDGEFAKGVIPIGNGTQVADVRGSILRLYRSTQDGYEELRKGTEPYLKAQRAVIRQTFAQGNPGFLGSLAKGFTSSGFGGGGSGQGIFEGLGQSAGTTAKYALLGSTFYGLSRAIKQAGTELLDFEDSIAELEIATGKTPSSQFIDGLSESAARAGTNVGEAMDVAASGIRAFKDEIDAGKTSSEALGLSFAKQASIIATLTKTSLTDAAGNLKAIALGFNIPEQSFSRIADVLSGAKLIGGGDEKETGQALASIAVAFKQIGFSAEESGAIVSKVIAETDEGGTLVASRLTKISSIIGGASGQSAIIKLNESLAKGQKIEIGAGVTPAEQLKELGAVYKDLNQSQKNGLINSLGGTASAKELIVVLNNITELEKKASDPSNFSGKGAEEYAKRLENLRAVLTQIQGEIKNLTVTIAASGVFQPFFDFITHGLLPALRITRQLAQGFGLIPGAIRGGLGYLLTFLAAAKALQLINRNGGISGAFNKAQLALNPQRALAQQQLSKQAAKDLRARLGNDPVALAQYKKEQKEAADRAARSAAFRRQFRGDILPARLANAGAVGTDRVIAGGAFAGRAVSNVARDSLAGLGAAAKFASLEVKTFGRDAVAAGRLGRATSGTGGAILGVGGAASRSAQRTQAALRSTVANAEVTRSLKSAFAPILAGARAGSALNGGSAFGAVAGAARAVGRVPGLGALDAARTGFGSIGKGVGSLAASTLGPLGAVLLTAGAVVGTVQAAHRIHTAVDDFNKLALVPDESTNAAASLTESAKNLTAAAHTLRDSSSGFFGTIVNALNGNPTGKFATIAAETASDQQSAANRIESKRKQILSNGSGGDLSDVFQFNTDDALSNSITAVANSGVGAEASMLAFQKALAKVGSTAAGSTANLDAFDQFTLTAKSGANALDALHNQQKAALIAGRDGTQDGLSLIGRGDDFINSKIGRGDAKTRAQAARAARTESTALGKVDQAKLLGATETKTKEFLAAGGDFNDPKQAAVFQATLASAYLGIYNNNKKAADQAAADAAKAIGADAKNIHGGGDQGATFTAISNQLTAYAEAFGARTSSRVALGETGKFHGTRDALDVKSGTLSPTINGIQTNVRNIGGISVGDNADLVGDKATLAQQQAGLENLKKKSDGSQKSADKIQAKADEIAALQVKVNQDVLANLQANQALLDSTIPPENTTQALEAQSKDLTAQIAAAKDPATRKQLKASKNQIDQQIGLSKIKDRFDVKRGKVDDRDVIGLDKLNVQQLQAEYLDIKGRGGSKAALANKQKEIDNAQRQQTNDEADLALATKDSSLDSASAVDNATKAVDEATAAVAKETKGTAAYVKAQKAKQDALKDQALTNLQAKQNAANLSIDLTNPVQVANKAVADAQALLTKAISDKDAPDVIVQKQLDVKNAQTNAESAAFSQFLTNTQNAEQLGTISHKAYLNLLQGRASQLQAQIAALGPLDNGRKQLQDELIQLQLAMKSAASDFSGQFNLGDIKIPTPYEVRRAIKSGDVGQVAKSNSALSTNGNVTDDHSTRNVILNGMPIQQVLSLIEGLFGVKARAKAARRIP